MRFVPVLIIAFTVAGCSGQDNAATDDVSIRIDNGVTIVENPGLHIADSIAWRLDTVPSVRIGMLEGPEEYVIGRLAGTLLRPGDSILIADATAHELRLVREYLPQRLARTMRPRWFVFDPEGRLRWSVRSAPGMQRTFRPSSKLSPQISGDRVLASERDADGVESVVIYRLSKKTNDN